MAETAGPISTSSTKVKVTAMDLLGIAPDWPTEADEIKAAEERGYRQAITDLRDRDAFMWWAAREQRFVEDLDRLDLADFLESRLTDGGEAG